MCARIQHPSSGYRKGIQSEEGLHGLHESAVHVVEDFQSSGLGYGRIVRLVGAEIPTIPKAFFRLSGRVDDLMLVPGLCIRYQSFRPWPPGGWPAWTRKFGRIEQDEWLKKAAAGPSGSHVPVLVESSTLKTRGTRTLVMIFVSSSIST